MEKAGSHKQVWVKVDALVDEGIAPLVLALTEFEGVRTYSSCQGGEFASVQFGCGGWAGAASFVGDVLVPVLERQDGLGAWASVTLYTSKSVHVSLCVPPENTRALADLVASFKAGRGPQTSRD